MRSTVRIDDDLMEALKARAARDGTSITKTLNAVIREGLAANSASRQPPFVQRQVSLGTMRRPEFGDKALALSAMLEDEALLAKLAVGK